jgi:hypothetical protein
MPESKNFMLSLTPLMLPGALPASNIELDQILTNELARLTTRQFQ